MRQAKFEETLQPATSAQPHLLLLSLTRLLATPVRIDMGNITHFVLNNTIDPEQYCL